MGASWRDSWSFDRPNIMLGCGRVKRSRSTRRPRPGDPAEDPRRRAPDAGRARRRRHEHALGGGGGRRPALARPLPLRRQAGPAGRGAGARERGAARAPAGALCRARAAGRQVAHGLRLPRRGHPLRLRARAVGAVGGRAGRRGAQGRLAAGDRRLARPAHRRVRRLGAPARAPTCRCRRGRPRRWWPTCSTASRSSCWPG